MFLYDAPELVETVSSGAFDCDESCRNLIKFGKLYKNMQEN